MSLVNGNLEAKNKVKFMQYLVKVKVLVALSCSTLCNTLDYSFCPWNSPGKNTGVGSHSLLQVIFVIQGWSPDFPSEPPGKPTIPGTELNPSRCKASRDNCWLEVCICIAPNIFLYLWWKASSFVVHCKMMLIISPYICIGTNIRWYYSHYICIYQGFPDSSVGQESACNGGDSSLIPGSGRSTEDGIGYPLQYSWVSFVAQLVKNPPAMQETWVRSLGWEGKGYPLQYCGLENSMDYIVHGVQSQTWLTFTFTIV